MGYEIDDRNLISMLCEDIRPMVQAEREKLKKSLESFNPPIPLREDFKHPLDDDIIGTSGALKKLVIPTDDKMIAYSNIGMLDELWRTLLNRAIICLRYFDHREPFLRNPSKDIVAYGLDRLRKYHDRYTEFESLMYGASSYYRDHIFHAFRVWMLGVFCLLVPKEGAKEPFIAKLGLDGGAELPGEINFFEYISMWTIIALCHDLGYPLEKSEQILDKTREMMQEFIPRPNIWNNFGFSGTQDSIHEYILKFISTKMQPAPKQLREHWEDKREAVPPAEQKEQAGAASQPQEDEEETGPNFVGRIQPKYYLKYAKSLEQFQHGIISVVIIYKILLYFLESDFNLNDDYIYETENARQFYIRREILRAIASHTCPDAYNVHITTFSSLLFLCDELQEWGRKTWNELYTGLNEASISLTIKEFTCDKVDIKESVNMEDVKDEEIVLQTICRIFERQYSLYKTTFRDGQYTSRRDFDLLKTIEVKLPKEGGKNRSITIEYALQKLDASHFKVDLSEAGSDKQGFAEKLKKRLESKMYAGDLEVVLNK